MPLYVVATPIGNLADLSPRAREVLSGASLLLCEDTRRTRTLLAALGLPSPELWSCHAHNEAGRLDAVLRRLEEGQSIALVSDAGTPGLSDPGEQIAAAALRAGHPVHPVPGPSAIAAALCASGLPAVPFHFLGFPPRKDGELRRWITEASRLPGTLVLLEAGRRAGELIAALAALLPDRQAALCRELTKIHEEIRLAPLGALPTEPQLGEVVLVVGPGQPVVEAAAAPTGEGLGEIADALARRWGTSRREAYQALLAMERQRGG